MNRLNETGFLINENGKECSITEHWCKTCRVQSLLKRRRKRKMRLVQIPETEESRRRGRIEDWLDLDSIESFQGYEDNSITITTKSGRSIKYGPFTDEDYDELINAILN